MAKKLSKFTKKITHVDDMMIYNLVRGTWRPSSFVDKLLSEKQDQGDRDCVHERDLVAGSDTLSECFNNVNVGASL